MNDFYKIELTQHALKDLDKLKEQSAKVLKALSALKEKPHLLLYNKRKFRSIKIAKSRETVLTNRA